MVAQRIVTMHLPPPGEIMNAEHEELEIKLAYQEDAIEKLSQQIHQQSQELARLRQYCQQLETRLQRLAENQGEAPQDERPPHY